MTRSEMHAQAQQWFEGMIALDLSRESMEIRLDEVESQARRVEDPARMRAILDTCGPVRRLISRDPKLATAGLLAGRHRRPYSQL